MFLKMRYFIGYYIAVPSKFMRSLTDQMPKLVGKMVTGQLSFLRSSGYQ